MKVEPNPGNANGRIVTHAAPSGRKIEVRVSARTDLNRPDRLEPAEVSWHAVGYVTPDDADAFADAIKHAVSVARGLDKANGHPGTSKGLGLADVLEKIREIADGRRHYDGGEGYTCFDALGEIRDLCEKALEGKDAT